MADLFFAWGRRAFFIYPRKLFKKLILLIFHLKKYLFKIEIIILINKIY